MLVLPMMTIKEDERMFGEETMSTMNRITLKAYEHKFADRALVSQSYFCCRGNRCRERCHSLGKVYCNTSDFPLAFYKRQLLDRASKTL